MKVVGEIGLVKMTPSGEIKFTIGTMNNKELLAFLSDNCNDTVIVELTNAQDGTADCKDKAAEENPDTLADSVSEGIDADDFIELEGFEDGDIE